jgi:hypothetical protein
MESAERQLTTETRPPIRCAHLIAPESRRRAFYRIWIEDCGGGFRVCKESGASGHVWDRRAWELGSLEEAERLFTRRVWEKTDSRRKRTWTYWPTPL